MTFAAVGISAFAMWTLSKNKMSTTTKYGLTVFINDNRKKIWKYLLFGGEMPKIESKVELPIFEEFVPVINHREDIPEVIRGIYKLYLKELEPALEDGLDKKRFFNLKLQYG
jgi:hypothetical protein